MIKKIFKTILFVVPWILFFYAIYFFTKIHDVSDKNGHSIDESRYKNNFLQNDQSYIFYSATNKKIVSVSKDKKIIQKELINNSFLINPVYNDKITFQINLKDSLHTEADSYTTDQKILAVSDIEGNFKVFTELLINNKIIDKNLNWIFGKGHLVCNGDFFDRGNDVTATLWLIYKLEQEAEKQGGKVHFMLGNHEEMNLRGFVKYVKLKYETLAVMLNIPYKELYGKDSELGRWLRTKNTMIKINDVLFTHGGISPLFVEKKYSIQEGNNLIRSYLGEDVDYIKFINPRAYFLFDRQGPMWYRGYFGDYKEYYKGTSQKEIDNISKYLNVSRIVVGHSIVDKVKPLFQNKIIAIDAMEENDPRKQDDDLMAKSCQALLIENNVYYRIFSNGKKEKLF